MNRGVDRGAIVGVSDHSGWAVLMTVSAGGTLLDRRRIELVDSGLPTLPHHHEAQRLPLDQALDLIERVRSSANGRARAALDALARSVGSSIGAIALRELPRLPPTTAERIQSYWAQTRADGVMYREALAAAAESRGWSVHWYDAKTVIDAAATALNAESLDAHFADVRKSIGPPWGKDQRMAAAAAILAASSAR